MSPERNKLLPITQISTAKTIVMEVTVKPFTVVIALCSQFVLLISLSPSNDSAPSSLCSPSQSLALLQFKKTMILKKSASNVDCDMDSGLNSYPKTASWREGTDCCLWDGVVCDELSGNVISVDLSCSWLYGKIPSNSTLFLLSHLQRLNLAYNDFSGSSLPSALGQLVNLRHLNISYSSFSGKVPSQISHLSKLVSLDLKYNIDFSFSDMYNIEFSESKSLILENPTFEALLKNMTLLEHLFLHYVDMSGVNPKLFLNVSTSLESIGLSNCLLHGELPVDVFNLVYLKQLRVSYNSELIVSLPKSNWSGPLESLDLSDTRFSGEQPYSVNLKSLRSLILFHFGLEGSIPSFIWNLTEITYLSLQDNKITGEIPTFLSNLKQLTYLTLSNNNLRGQVPDLFGNLTELTVLDLRVNNLEGHLPSSLFSHSQLLRLYLSENELVSLPTNVSGPSKLTVLELMSNKLNGTIPSWLFNLSSLTFLNLRNNQISGEILEFQSKSLEYLYLDHNMLHGRIPASMFELPNLTSLYLSANNLFFGINELAGFQKLKNLFRLDLSYTKISLPTTNTVDLNWPKLWYLSLSSCNISEFPKLLRSQDELKILDLSNNNIRGNIPRWVFNVGKETLWFLNLSYNCLTGTMNLPWQKLRIVDINSNMLHGSLPAFPPIVSIFSVSNNSLSGNVSSSICAATSLEILDLSHNNLGGKIPPCLGNFSTSLTVLNLKKNNFEGTIGNTFSEECHLRNLNFQGNKLEGSMPNSLVKCKELEVLDLGENMLNDRFPSWLGILQRLRVLVLRSNNLHGSIQDLRTKNSFPTLLVLDLSNNKFTGYLPASFIKFLKTMMIDVDSDQSGNIYLGTHNSITIDDTYDYSMTVNFKGTEMEIQKIFHVFTSIDLSNNKFQGGILDDLGKLHSLRGLNLSHNDLSGHIPPSLGDLTSLEWLDLSSNKLVGEIPNNLTQLTSLAIFNVSKNKLVGPIPQGNQFNTFSNDSYQGNLGLCGFPLSTKCHDEESHTPQPPPVTDSSSFFENGLSWQPVVIGYGSGLTVGLIMGSIMFQTRRPRWLWRRIDGILFGKLGRRRRPRN